MLNVETLLPRLMTRMPDVDNEELLTEMLYDAESYIKAQTGRETVPEELTGCLMRLAEAFYNRLGTSGETSHAEGSVTRAIDAKLEEINKELRRYQVAKVLK